ncbi:MAG: hypothetical protein JWQ71_1522 [Pedosphaera sp.]|nr:hypothetical protein [Pedosphaera sp.]
MAQKHTTIDNATIAELLCREAEKTKPPLQRALRRAGRAALLWPEEAAEVVRQNRTLREFPAIGPYLEKIILKWIDDPPLALGPIPEIRRNFLTLTEARAILAENPQWRSLVRGDLQMHTEWSDGSANVRDMAQSAVQLGHSYISITDHAKGLKIAGGINEAELSEQAREIEAVNDEFNQGEKPLRILHSIELNLNPQGEGDMDLAALNKLDIVLGAFHSALRKKEDQTERYLAALRNPALHILGHPRGRIFNFRLGLYADWPRVFGLAAELDRAVEIDCYPDRQDLDVSLLKVARAAGVRISLGTDAHHPWQLRFVEFGLAAAKLARIPQDRILNFMSSEQLLSWADNVREYA